MKHSKGMPSCVSMGLRRALNTKVTPKPLTDDEAFEQAEQARILADNLAWNAGRNDRIRFIREQVETLVQYTGQNWIRTKSARRIPDLCDSHTAYEFLEKNLRFALADKKTYCSVVDRLVGEQVWFVPACIK